MTCCIPWTSDYPEIQTILKLLFSGLYSRVESCLTLQALNSPRQTPIVRNCKSLSPLLVSRCGLQWKFTINQIESALEIPISGGWKRIKGISKNRTRDRDVWTCPSVEKPPIRVQSIAHIALFHRSAIISPQDIDKLLLNNWTMAERKKWKKSTQSIAQ